MTAIKPLALANIAIENNSIPQLKYALEQKLQTAGTGWPHAYTDFVRRNFRVALSHNMPEFVSYLLENEPDHVSTSLINESHLWNSASIPLLELLVSKGWDINRASPNRQLGVGERLMYSPHVLGNEELVVWMVEHGARIDGGQTGLVQKSSPPLLQNCAAHGSVKSFKFLREKGAKMGRRTLHMAVQMAACYGADPSSATAIAPQDGNQERGLKETRRHELEAMLRYLVDELRLDVNAVEIGRPEVYGTPFNYAASEKKGARVVRWLLGKGAHPTWVNVWQDTRDAEAWAQTFGNEETEQLLQEWKNCEKGKKRRNSI